MTAEREKKHKTDEGVKQSDDIKRRTRKERVRWELGNKRIESESEGGGRRKVR